MSISLSAARLKGLDPERIYSLAAGHAIIGIESGERDDSPLTFALPGNANEIYFEIKRPAADRQLAPLPELWGME